MNEDEARLMEAEGERNSWVQVLKQTADTVTAYEDGWEGEDALAEAIALRDRCREEIAQLDILIAELRGEEPPAAPEKVGDAITERVTGAEDAVADLSEVASETIITAQDNADAIAELSEIVSGLVGGDE